MLTFHHFHEDCGSDCVAVLVDSLRVLVSGEALHFVKSHLVNSAVFTQDQKVVQVDLDHETALRVLLIEHQVSVSEGNFEAFSLVKELLGEICSKLQIVGVRPNLAWNLLLLRQNSSRFNSLELNDDHVLIDSLDYADLTFLWSTADANFLPFFEVFADVFKGDLNFPADVLTLNKGMLSFMSEVLDDSDAALHFTLKYTDLVSHLKFVMETVNKSSLQSVVLQVVPFIFRRRELSIFAFVLEHLEAIGLFLAGQDVFVLD